MPGYSSRRTPHARNHCLDMADRRFRRNAMAEVEDQRTVSQCLQDAIHPVSERLPARNEPQRIEVALNRSIALQALDLVQRGRPVETQGGNAGRLPVAVVNVPAPRGKPIIGTVG